MHLLFVGECTEVKGLKYLIEALGYVRDLEWILYIAGQYDIRDSYYRKIKKIITLEGMNERINFLGFVLPDELREYYRKSSIYIFPSLSEGYGKSLAEALFFGLPIIASNSGAIPELVRDGVNAILVEPGNSKSLAEAIRSMAADPSKMDGMSKANIELSGRIHTWDMYNRELEERLIPVIAQVAGIHSRDEYISNEDRQEQND